MKKKILSILLCGFLLISLTGCGSKGLSDKDVIGIWIIEKATCKKAVFMLLCMYAKKLHKIKKWNIQYSKVLSATHKELTPYSLMNGCFFILELQKVIL